MVGSGKTDGIGRARTPAAPHGEDGGGGGNGAAGVRALPLGDSCGTGRVPGGGAGRVRTPAAPSSGGVARPVRKRLDHRGPLCIDVSNAIYFVTIAAAERGGTAFIDNAAAILDAARFYQTKARWFLHLFLIMPDHVHMLVHVTPTLRLADVIGHWKSYLSAQKGIRFQSNFFDTRIRNETHFAEKWNYICRNPVVRGIAGTPSEWNHVIAFDPQTGEERVHW